MLCQRGVIAESSDETSRFKVVGTNPHLNNFEVPAWTSRLKSQIAPLGTFTFAVSVSPWREALAIGDRLDALDHYNKWFVAEVKETDDADCILLHYDGWPDKYDEWVHRFVHVSLCRTLRKRKIEFPHVKNNFTCDGLKCKK